MNFNQPKGIAAVLMLVSAAAFAADAAPDHPLAAAPGVDRHAQPAFPKKVRKQARAKPHQKVPAHGTQANVQSPTQHAAPDSYRSQSASDSSNAVAQMSNPLQTADVTHASPAADAQATPAAQAGRDASAMNDPTDAPVVKDDHAAHADSPTVPDIPTQIASETDHCNPPLKSEIAALFDRWNASLRTGDPKKVVANYAPGSILLPTVSNRARFTAAEKEDYFAYFLDRRPEGTIDDRVIEVDCNSATDAGLYTFRFADGTAVKARYSFSYRKTSLQWLITSHHSSGMPEKAEVAAEQQVSETALTEPAARTEQGPPVKGWVRYP